MAKTKNSFDSYVKDIKEKSGFRGVVTHGDLEYLYRLYKLSTVAVFKEECMKFFKRKKEEN